MKPVATPHGDAFAAKQLGEYAVWLIREMVTGIELSKKGL